jgi:hypothetical protein
MTNSKIKDVINFETNVKVSHYVTKQLDRHRRSLFESAIVDHLALYEIRRIFAMYPSFRYSSLSCFR